MQLDGHFVGQQLRIHDINASNAEGSELINDVDPSNGEGSGQGIARSRLQGAQDLAERR